MKIKALFFCLLVCVNITSKGQKIYKNNTVIEMDMVTGKEAPGNFTIKNKATLRYKLSNFNKSLYTVSINSTASTLFTEQPAIFSLVTKIDNAKLTDAISDLRPSMTFVAHIAVDATQKASIGKQQTQQTEFLTAVNNYNADYKKMSKIIEYYDQLNTLFKDGLRSFTVIEDEKIFITEKLFNNQFGSAANSIPNNMQQTELETQIKTLFNQIEDDFDKVKKEYRNLKSENVVFQGIVNRMLVDKKDAQTAEQNKEAAIKPDNKTSRNAIAAKQTIIKNIADIKSEIAKISSTSDAETNLLSIAEELYDDVKTANTKVETIKGEKFIQKTVDAYARIHRSNFEYISQYIHAEKDQIKVSINVQPKDPVSQVLNYNQFNGDFTGTVTGFKINFSTGVFGIFGNKMFDQSYRLDPVAPTTPGGSVDSNVIRKNDTKASIAPAFGALMHFYNKRPGGFNWGGNFGMSISGDAHINFHAGASIIFGEEQRIILSGGLTLAQAKLITDQYRENQVIHKSVALNPVPTQGFYQTGFFLAFTYNVSK